MTTPSSRGESPLTPLLAMIAEHHRLTQALSEHAALIVPRLSTEEAQRAADALDDVALVDRAYGIFQRAASDPRNETDGIETTIAQHAHLAG